MTSLQNIGIDSVGFILLAGCLVLVGWSARSDWLIRVIALTGTLMALSWLRPIDAVALVIVLLPSYLAARIIWGKRSRAQRGVAAIVVALQVMLFLILKRYAWFDVLGWLEQPVAVIGLSYILFRQIHLLVDAPYLGDHSLTPVRYIAFMLCPWTLMAGPIQRYDAFYQGVADCRRPSSSEMLSAMHRGINGLIKAFVLSPLFLEPSRLGNLQHPDATLIDLLIVVYGFPIYLYLNFAGYTDFVIGAARLAGFRTLPENFNSPFLAHNSRDFWTRWHISFGIWVRHYVFTPLSTWLTKLLPENAHQLALLVAVIVTFLLVGGWHGTTANYFLFGLTQAGGVIVSATFEAWRRKQLGRQAARELAERSWFKGLSIFITFNYTCVCLILLNGSLDQASAAISAFLFK